ncbi:MAG: DUF4369 domain-containing protein [Bacteroidota bacterium]
MLKNILAISLIKFTMLSGSEAQPSNNGFVIKGSITGREEGYVYLSYAGSDGKNVKDSCAIMNGGFTFKGNISGACHGCTECKRADKKRE